jgi:hypothetical protein
MMSVGLSIGDSEWQRPSDPFRAELRDDEPIGLLRLSGEADLMTREDLRRELLQAETLHPNCLVLDVTELRFCDVGCAELILWSAQRTPIIMVGATGTVERLFQILDPKGTVTRHETYGTLSGPATGSTSSGRPSEPPP